MIKLWACSLALLYFCTLSVKAVPQSNVISTSPAVLQPQTVDLELATANIIYLGETHDSKADHQAQLEIIQRLHQKQPQIALALEMFQRPFQGVINDYLAGKLTEAELLAKTEYEKRWGFPWELYAPILRYAKTHQIPILAINVPTEITRQVARNGLEKLTEADKRWIPPIDELDLSNSEYRAMLLSVFQQHQQAGLGNADAFERFLAAQVLWDETMAESIAQFVRSHPQTQVIVLAGQRHIMYGYGIPNRVQRRLKDFQFVQRSVLLSPESDMLEKPDHQIADYIWMENPTPR